MQNFNLTTWSGDQLVGYEPIIAASTEEAIAFVHGMLAERTRGETDFLMKMAIRYVVDQGHRDFEDIAIISGAPVGTWHIAERRGASMLLWQPTGAGN